MDRLHFVCDGHEIDVPVEPGESLLDVLRERLWIRSVKDGCAPQGQCGCCTVLVDGKPRVACVTPASRVSGREITTPDGLDPDTRDRFCAALVDTGGSQCGFCTPGIVMRLASGAGTDRAVLDRALSAHLCRCTGWQTIREAAERVGTDSSGKPIPVASARDLEAAGRRAELEGGVAQRVSLDVPVGAGGFADDRAPSDALVAVPKPPGSSAEAVEAAGIDWVVAESLHAVRSAAGKTQGRRTSAASALPLLPDTSSGGVALSIGWIEPAYLEPDASWCEPGGVPASPLANGGAFGAKSSSPVGTAARELADRYGRAVRVLFSREDCVRLGPKRPPVAATARYADGAVTIRGTLVGDAAWMSGHPLARRVELDAQWRAVVAAGPPTSDALRAVGALEQTLLVEAAARAAGLGPEDLLADERGAAAALDSCARVRGGATAGARVELTEAGAPSHVGIRVAAGDPLDETVLRSYAVGGAHMGLGLVFSESLNVDPDTGEVMSSTIRSFGVLRAGDTPPIEVEVVDDPGPPLPRSSDAVMAAVAASAWHALARRDGTYPAAFPVGI